MSAALKVDLIEARVTSSPEYNNEHLDVQSRWLRDNHLLLKEWFYEDNEDAKPEEFPLFCLAQYDVTCNEVSALQAEWDLERRDEIYDRGRPL